jgi:hypothetical protein
LRPACLWLSKGRVQHGDCVTEHISQNAAVASQRFAEAHHALRANPIIQFSMAPLPPPAPPPKWLIDFIEWLARVLKPLARFFGWISQYMPQAPYARIFLWTVIGVAALAVIWLVIERLRYGQWRLPRLRRSRAVAAAPAEEEEWALDAAPVRAWLDEADALAAQGRYAEAVHHLLFRSIQDIEQRRPNLVRPALTSRELSAASAIPGAARNLFAGIARVVERSLFGGRAVDADEWQAARATYADFVTAGSWRG